MKPKLGSCYYPEHWPEERGKRMLKKWLLLAYPGFESVNLHGAV